MDRLFKVLLIGFAIAQVSAQPQSRNSNVTPADYQRWKQEFRNWGRWGADDEREQVI